MKIINQNQYSYKINGYELSDIHKLNYVVFDLEATGLDTKNDYITQFGAVIIKNRKFKINLKYKSYVYSPKKIPKFIVKLTGVTNANIKNAPSIVDVIKPIWEKYKNYIWVAQCGFEFDFNILYRQLAEKGHYWFKPKILDTKIMFSYLHNDIEKTPSTDFLLKYYGIKTKIKRHDALNDSIIVSKILKEVLDDYKKNNCNSIIIKKVLRIKKFYIQKRMEIDIVTEGIRVKYGGKFDKTKAVSPFVLNTDGFFNMLYVGSSSAPAERIGYKILSATSKNGLEFKKNPLPYFKKIKISRNNINHFKEYSPCLLLTEEGAFFYYADNSSGLYDIKSIKLSDSVFKFVNTKKTIKDNLLLTKHSPKLFKHKKKYFCYYTASKSSKKIYSKKYPQYDFANGFNIFLAKSDSPLEFQKSEKVNFIDFDQKYKNFYGHSVFLLNDVIYMCVTIFDGSINKISLFKSKDGINFHFIKVLIAPNEINELGCYSSSALVIKGSCVRLYYGVRYFDNHWSINSLYFRIKL